MVGLFVPLAVSISAAAVPKIRRCEKLVSSPRAERTAKPKPAPAQSILAMAIGEEHEASHLSRVEHLRELQKRPVIEVRAKRGDDEPDFIQVSGVPAEAQFIETDGSEVFRHYSPHADEMRSRQILRAGVGSYYKAAPHEILWYDDLTGVVVNTANCKPPIVPKIFRAGKNKFVDVKLPVGLTLLRLDDCTYLIPGNPDWQPWILDAYRSGKPQPLLANVFKQIKAAGNLLSPLEIPFVLTRTWTGSAAF